MRKIKNFKISCLFFMALIAVVACKEKDNTLKVSNDVVFLKKVIDNETRYGIAYYLQTNQGLDSVTVTMPLGGKSVKLKQHETNTYLFMREPSNSEFTNIAPVDGDYLFKIASKKGEYLEVADEQHFSDLPFAEIDSTGFDTGSLWFYVRWVKVPSADAYELMLFKSSGEMIFNSITVPATASTEYKISAFHITGTWVEAPKKDQKYKLKINAIKYDSATNKDDYYNVQEISETVYAKEITWQLE